MFQKAPHIVPLLFLLYSGITFVSCKPDISPLSTQNPPVLTFGTENITARQRSTVVLTCPINCEPSCKFDWTKNTEHIFQWDRFQFLTPSNAQLQIRSLEPDDAGTYACRGVNGHGSIEAKVNVVVQGDEPSETNLIKRTAPTEIGSRPQIMIESLPVEDSVTVTQGQSLFLRCEAKGHPIPNVTWFKNNLYLLESSDNVSLLRLTNVTQSDAANYKCLAQNSYGKSIYELRVRVDGGYGGTAELLSLRPTNLTLLPGQSGSFTCSVQLEESYSKPLLLWLKRILTPPQLPLSDTVAKNIFVHEGDMLEIVDRPEIIQTSANTYSATLTLRNVTRSMAGVYVCVLAGPLRTVDFSFLEATLMVPLDTAHIEPNRRKTTEVQLKLLWIFGFLVVVICAIFIFCRFCGYRRNQKKWTAVPRTRPNPIGSSFRVAIPNKSPGETVSTTLTHQNETFRPFLQQSDTSSGLAGQSSFPSRNSIVEISSTPNRKRTYRQRRMAELAALNGSSTNSDSDSFYDSNSGGNMFDGNVEYRIHRIPIAKTIRSQRHLAPVAPVT